MRSGTRSTGRQVLYYGRFYESSGYSAEARSYALGLRSLGFRVQILPVPDRRSGRDLIPATEVSALNDMQQERVDPLSAVTLFHLKPGTYPNTGSPVQVARTMFESDRIPSEWVPVLNGLSEVWVPSLFNLETFAAAGVDSGKLRYVRQGIDTARFHPLAPAYPLPERRGFTFLSSFDWLDRKGWDLLVRAYLTEFKPDEDVILVLWVQSFHHTTQAIQKQLDRLIAVDLGITSRPTAPILLLTDPCPDDVMPGVYTACDVFVLPTRGEGWGRPFAEAMACGKPVIGTAWGGNLDFMTEENSYLIETEGLVPVNAGVDIALFRGHRWAQPSVEHLRQLMRRVFEHPAEATARGARARADVASQWDLRTILQEFAAQLDRLYN